MVRAGFTKEIKADNGIPYILPQGMYFASTEKTKTQVLDIACSIVSRLKMQYKVLVTESNGSAWANLDPA